MNWINGFMALIFLMFGFVLCALCNGIKDLCSISSDVRGRFEGLPYGVKYEIITDKQTGQEYLYTWNGSSAGLSELLE